MPFAAVISRLFEPLVVLAVTAVLAGVRAGLTGAEFFRYGAFLLFAMFGPVVGFRVWLVKAKKLDWDIRDRRKRMVPLLVMLGFVALDTLLIRSWGSVVLTQLFLTFFAWTLGFFLITLVWKISGHSSVIALATGFLIQWFGWSWWPVLFVMPLVAWARVVTKNHTISQVVAGALYSLGLLELVKLVPFDQLVVL